MGHKTISGARQNIVGLLGVGLVTGGTFAWLFAGPGMLDSAERIIPAVGIFVLGVALLWIAWVRPVSGDGGKSTLIKGNRNKFTARRLTVRKSPNLIEGDENEFDGGDIDYE
jgi:hypothetical protein